MATVSGQRRNHFPCSALNNPVVPGFPWVLDGRGGVASRERRQRRGAKEWGSADPSAGRRVGWQASLQASTTAVRASPAGIIRIAGRGVRAG